jgi:hypothetical protein
MNLPTELFYTILDYAEYWSAEYFSHCHDIQLYCDTGLPESMTLYLQTSAIGSSGIFKNLPTADPRKVVFTITAHSGDPLYNLTYGGPSWFDVSIFRDGIAIWARSHVDLIFK